MDRVQAGFLVTAITSGIVLVASILDHLGERFSIVEELGPPQDRGRGATAPRFVCQPPGLSFMM